MPKRLRLRLRMGLGSMMLGILIFGLWFAAQVNRAKEQRRAVEAVRAAGGWVRYGDEFAMGTANPSGWNPLFQPSWGTLAPNQGPAAPERIRRWLGDEFFREIVHVSTFVDIQKGTATAPGSDRPPLDDTLRTIESQRSIRTLQLGGESVTGEGLASIAKLRDLMELIIWWAGGVDDAGVSRIAALPRLRVVHISLSALTDEGVGHLADLPALEELNLQGKRFTDRSLAHLSRAKHLRSLSLSGGQTEFTDAGLEHLAVLKDLRQLALKGGTFSNEAKQRLLKANPGLTIVP